MVTVVGMLRCKLHVFEIPPPYFVKTFGFARPLAGNVVIVVGVVTVVDVVIVVIVATICLLSTGGQGFEPGAVQSLSTSAEAGRMFVSALGTRQTLWPSVPGARYRRLGTPALVFERKAAGFPCESY